MSKKVAEAIPYASEKERFKIENQERKKNRYVEVWDKLKLVYSAEKLI